MDLFTLEKLEFDRLRQILARFCRCSLGAGLALRIGPSRRPETVRTWLAQTTEMVNALREIGTPPYGGVSDITENMVRATPGGGASGEDFATIASTLDACGRIRDWTATLEENKPLLKAMGQAIGSFDGEVRAIQAIVDERGEVRDSASDRLANIRREIEACQRQIREIVYSFTRRADVAPYLQSTTVQLHEDRYVLPVKAESRGRLAGVVHRSSHTGATVFVEPAGCVELNNRLVRLHDDHRDEIARLLGQLSIRVHARAEEILHSLHALAQLDLVTAKAQYAYQFDFTCPEVTERGPLQFYHARHPLLIEQAYQQETAGLGPEERHAVVPIDVRLGEEFDLLTITGSNTGGKTVAMKTVALLVLMAQSGMHIPVQAGATMPVFRDVLLDVGDEQSLEQSLSTFGAHLKRIRNILLRADQYSLVLLDELGSGTDPEEGGAIGQAILDELRAIGCMGMVTTHLGVLKSYAYTHDRVENASVDFDTATLRPTFRLLIGQPGESHAIVVAEHYGLPQRVIQAARQHLPKQTKQLRQALRATAASRKASEEARTEAHQAKLDAQTQQEMYQAKLNQIETLGQQFTEWISSLPAMQPGDPVFVRRLNKSGTLERLQLSKQIAVVNVDKLQVEVPLQELMPDLGDPKVVNEIASLRKQVADQARQTQEMLDQAQRTQKEYHRSMSALRARQQQFDAWLAALGKVNVGDEVTFNKPPGHGKLTQLDLRSGKATVETRSGPMEVRLLDLFPDAAPFGQPHGARGPRQGQHPGRGPQGQEAPGEESHSNRPMVHRSPDSRAARSSRDTLLHTPPGQQVYVVSFQKRATLIRLDAEKQIAVLQSGAFEMQVPLADIEPIHADNAGAPKPKGTKRQQPVPGNQEPERTNS